MPISARKPCSYPGCGQLVHGRPRCDDHKRIDRKRYDDLRGSSSERGYGAKWRKARLSYLAENPYCKDHIKKGFHVLATIVDHIIPHRLHEAKQSGVIKIISNAENLFWDRNNWQSLCKTCHDKKTHRQDGAFGRGRVRSS